MTFSERAISFSCHQHNLMGIVNQPSGHIDTGVLIIVGGPQYRVGSHRQFTQLARALGSQKIPSMRFDYRGMGDSEGEKQPFDDICDDISAAVDSLIEATGVKKVVLWGLCDAASASMIYAHKDERIAGQVLLNPWLRSDQAMGKTMLKYYYLQRLMSRDFWAKLFGGNVKLGKSLSDAKGFAADSLASSDSEQGAYQQRMCDGLTGYRGKLCLILSGVDLTAKEFEEQTLGNKKWKRLKRADTLIHRIANADHTFSSATFKAEVENVTITFVKDVA